MSSDDIKVVVRARPLLGADPKTIPWVIDGNSIFQKDEDNTPFGETYSYDKIFNIDEKNVDIYTSTVSPMVQSAIEGINLSIFAYGATSSGKTYTMIGNNKDSGVIPRIVEDIFEKIEMCKHRKFLLRVSYVEIYSETINDLLDKNNKDLKIREDVNSCVSYNPTEKIIKCREECLAIMRKGNANRTTGETQMNISSSRSHSIFRIVIESTENLGDENDPVQVSHLNLIDLAGSERASQTGATGQRFREGAHINKSLTVLGVVIRQLVEKREYISYRDSKLTRILSNSLGGNAKTIMICNIRLESVEDTLCTLMFAQRAKAIKNKPKVNEILTEAALTKKYAKEFHRTKELLDAESEKNKKLEEERIMSTKKIADLNTRIQNLEEIFVKKGTAKKLPKRRHTLSLCSIAEERELTTISRNTIFEEDENDYTKTTFKDDTLTSLKSGDLEGSCSTPESKPRAVMEETPVQNLRDRLQTLSQEYEELVEFTRFEKSARLSCEQDMVAKMQGLMEECEELRSYREYAQMQIRELKMEAIKAEQINNDYGFIIETQKKKFDKREHELLEQINELLSKTTLKPCTTRESICLPKPQINMFEYEELSENLESLRKQNDELQRMNEYLKLRNTELENNCNIPGHTKSLTQRLDSIEIQNSQLQAKNKSLKSKCLELTLAVDDLQSNNYTEIVNSLKQKISDLENIKDKLESELLSVKMDLCEAQDKLIEVSQDLDIEEKKTAVLEEQLKQEKTVREQVELKLMQKEQVEFKNHERCRTLDSDVLQSLYQLQTILKSEQTQEIESSQHAIMNPFEDNATKKSSDATTQDTLDIDLENMKNFSGYFFKGTDKSEVFMNFFNSFISGSSSTSDRKIGGAELNNQENNFAARQTNIIENKNVSQTITIVELQKGLEKYYERNLCDSEKIQKTNRTSSSRLIDLEILKAEKDNYLLLVEELKSENAKKSLTNKELQDLYETKCSTLKEKEKEILLMAEKDTKFVDTIDTLSNEIESQKNIILDQNLIIEDINKKLDEIRSNQNQFEEKNEEILVNFDNIKCLNDIENLGDEKKSVKKINKCDEDLSDENEILKKEIQEYKLLLEEERQTTLDLRQSILKIKDMGNEELEHFRVANETLKNDNDAVTEIMNSQKSKIEFLQHENENNSEEREKLLQENDIRSEVLRRQVLEYENRVMSEKKKFEELEQQYTVSLKEAEALKKNIETKETEHKEFLTLMEVLEAEKDKYLSLVEELRLENEKLLNNKELEKLCESECFAREEKEDRIQLMLEKHNNLVDTITKLNNEIESQKNMIHDQIQKTKDIKDENVFLKKDILEYQLLLEEERLTTQDLKQTIFKSEDMGNEELERLRVANETLKNDNDALTEIINSQKLKIQLLQHENENNSEEREKFRKENDIRSETLKRQVLEYESRLISEEKKFEELKQQYTVSLKETETLKKNIETKENEHKEFLTLMEVLEAEKGKYLYLVEELILENKKLSNNTEVQELYESKSFALEEKEKELQLMRENNKNLVDAITTLNNEIESQKNMIHEQNQKAEGLNDENAFLKIDIQEFKLLLEEERRTTLDLQQTIHKMKDLGNEELEHLRVDNETLKNANNAQTEIINSQKISIQLLQHENENNSKEREKLQKENDVRSEAFRRQVLEYENRLKSEEKKFEELEQQYAVSLKEAEDLKKHIETKENEHKEFLSLIEVLEAEKDKYLSLVEELRLENKKLLNNEEVQKLYESKCFALEENEKVIQLMRENNRNLVDTITTLNNEIESQKTMIHEQNQKTKDLNGEKAFLKENILEHQLRLEEERKTTMDLKQTILKMKDMRNEELEHVRVGNEILKNDYDAVTKIINSQKIKIQLLQQENENYSDEREKLQEENDISSEALRRQVLEYEKRLISEERKFERLEQQYTVSLKEAEALKKNIETEENEHKEFLTLMGVLEAEKDKYLSLVEELRLENEKLLDNKEQQELYASKCFALEEKEKRIQLVLEKNKNLVDTITALNNKIESQKNMIHDQIQKNKDLDNENALLKKDILEYQLLLEKERQAAVDLNQTIIKIKEMENKELLQLKVSNEKLENDNAVLAEIINTQKRELQKLTDIHSDAFRRQVLEYENRLMSEKKKFEELKQQYTICLQEAEGLKKKIETKENEHKEFLTLKETNEKSSHSVRSESADELTENLFVQMKRLEEIVYNGHLAKLTARERLLKSKTNLSSALKLEKFKLLVDRVSSLSEERNLLKQQNEVDYKRLKQLHDNLDAQFKMKNRQFELLDEDHKTLKNDHTELKEKFERSMKQNEHMASSYAALQYKNEKDVKRIENLSFENQHLAEKLTQFEKRIRQYEKDALIAKESMKENVPRVLGSLDWNSEVIEKKDFEALRCKYEKLKKVHQACQQPSSEFEVTSFKKEDKWKKQRTEAHDSRRSIDLNTLCSETTVDTCSSCEHMNQLLQKHKSEVSQLRKTVDTFSSDLNMLRQKYENMKKLCRIRNEEIRNLNKQLSSRN